MMSGHQDMMGYECEHVCVSDVWGWGGRMVALHSQYVGFIVDMNTCTRTFCVGQDSKTTTWTIACAFHISPTK